MASIKGFRGRQRYPGPGSRSRTDGMIKRRQPRILLTERSLDHVLERLERAEKRVVAGSFLIVKIVSVVALVASLILLEAGVVRQIWKIEFNSAHALADHQPDPPQSPKAGLAEI